MGQHRLGIFRALLSQLPPGHLVDVATGHGKFAVVARDLGWRVTAFDARTERFPNANGIDFQQADVREFEFPPDTTAVSILGLLYHLELEDVRDLLSRVSHLPTIIDTHVAIHPDHTVDGVPGRLFWEDQDRPTASVGNPTSFWPTELALTDLLHEAGYASIWRHVPSHAKDRTFWLCLPASDDPDLVTWQDRVAERPLTEDDLLTRARERAAPGEPAAPVANGQPIAEASNRAMLRTEVATLRQQSAERAAGAVLRALRRLRDRNG